MKKFMKKSKSLFLVVCLLTFPFAFESLAQDSIDYEEISDEEYEMIIDKGKKVYEVRCLLCHGEKGDGKGLAGIIRRVEKNGQLQVIYPWDFTQGVFRFRTTPSGCLPDDKDLLGIITNGIPISLMPSYMHIPLEERNAIITYLKTFSDRWEEEEDEDEFCKPIAINIPEWIGSPDSVQKGEVIYKKMKCWECHGDLGAGDGPKAKDLKDDWGRTMLPFNFTSGELKKGSSPENVYVTFSTGLDGTAMPSYSDTLKEDDRWHLVSYTLKLMKKIK